MEITGIPNFDEISQSTAEIKLLPVSENGRPPFWISVSGFYFCLIFVIDVSFRLILHWPTIFCQNRTTLGGVMTSYRFFKMAAGSHIGFDLDNIRPPTKCNCCSEIFLKFGLERIRSFGRYCNFYILPFWLEIAHSRPFWGVLEHISPR